MKDWKTVSSFAVGIVPKDVQDVQQSHHSVLAVTMAPQGLAVSTPSQTKRLGRRTAHTQCSVRVQNMNIFKLPFDQEVIWWDYTNASSERWRSPEGALVSSESVCLYSRQTHLAHILLTKWMQFTQKIQVPQFWHLPNLCFVFNRHRLCCVHLESHRSLHLRNRQYLHIERSVAQVKIKFPTQNTKCVHLDTVL